MMNGGGGNMGRPAGMTRNALVISLGSVAALAVLVCLLSWSTSTPVAPRRTANKPAGKGDAADQSAVTVGESSPESSPASDGGLVVYCAAGIAKPIADAAAAYEKEFGTRIQLTYGGSGTLLTNLQVAKRGDVYLAADTSYITLARERDLLDEALPIARIHPVIAVVKGNPKKIHAVDDLLRADVKLALANPDAASIGKLTQKLLEKSGHWERVKAAATVFKPTVNEIANDVILGVVDAAVIWDANVRQASRLESVTVPEFENVMEEVTAGVLRSCQDPAAALKFVRYLQAPEKGQKSFAAHGYSIVDGDVWEEAPTLTLYSGGLNRIAIQETLLRFKAREGVDLNVVYNGCGILVGMMKVGGAPDAYFACDRSYLVPVQDKFLPAREVSETDMVIIVQKGNPKNVHSMADLAQPDLKLGVANEAQSTLGGLTNRLLEALNLYESVSKNFKVSSPTADYLVNQMATGSLDAAIVYQANVSEVPDKFDVVRITERSPTAVQPIAVAKDSRHKFLTNRLIDALTSRDSRQRFEAADFRWRLGAN